MSQLPTTLDDAIAQAKQATQKALNDGHSCVQIELVLAEIALQAQYIAKKFTPILSEYGSGLKVFFPDTGAAALARRDWGDVPFKIEDIGTSRSPITRRISPEDQAFLVVSPSSVEVGEVEKLCNLAEDRPVIILIPQLENVSIVGIGYAARQLRERFLSNLFTCYYVRTLEGAALTRFYPSPWQVWLEKGEDYELITELQQKPVGEALERIIFSAANPETDNQQSNSNKPKKKGILANMQSFLKALSQ
ncbi:MAG: DUF1995 family protein [Spirulinaceae cyanobacterium]